MENLGKSSWRYGNEGVSGSLKCFEEKKWESIAIIIVKELILKIILKNINDDGRRNRNNVVIESRIFFLFEQYMWK